MTRWLLCCVLCVSFSAAFAPPVCGGEFDIELTNRSRAGASLSVADGAIVVRLIGGGEKRTRVIEAQTGKELAEHETPGGKIQAVVGTSLLLDLTLYDIRTGTRRQKLGQYLCWAENGVYEYDQDAKALIRYSAIGKKEWTLPLRKAKLPALTHYSAIGDDLLYAGAGVAVKITNKGKVKWRTQLKGKFTHSSSSLKGYSVDGTEFAFLTATVEEKGQQYCAVHLLGKKRPKIIKVPDAGRHIANIVASSSYREAPLFKRGKSWYVMMQPGQGEKPQWSVVDLKKSRVVGRAPSREVRDYRKGYAIKDRSSIVDLIADKEVVSFPQQMSSIQVTRDYACFEHDGKLHCQKMDGSGSWQTPLPDRHRSLSGRSVHGQPNWIILWPQGRRSDAAAPVIVVDPDAQRSFELGQIHTGGHNELNAAALFADGHCYFAYRFTTPEGSSTLRLRCLPIPSSQ
ncbi:MAG: hypothetical protein AAF581_05430 [Planctomycetota bacterium]